jgi:hypothetical protein
MKLRAYFPLLLLLACNRNTTPAKAENSNRADVSRSEIRELSLGPQGRADRSSLEIKGAYYTKGWVNNAERTDACVGCRIRMTIDGDTSTKINIITDSTGAFSFHGRNNIFRIELDNPGFNRVIIAPVDLSDGGNYRITVVQAAGSDTEQFTVTRKGAQFSWADYRKNQ